MGLFGGPTLGVFLLGIFNPRANAEGCWCGLAVGVSTLFVCVTASIVCTKHAKTGMCTAAMLSEFWYGTVGSVLTLVVGSICSAAWPAVPRGQLVGLTAQSMMRGEQPEAVDGGMSDIEVEPMLAVKEESLSYSPPRQHLGGKVRRVGAGGS